MSHLTDGQVIAIAWLLFVVAGFAAFSFIADRRGRHRRNQ